MRLTDKIYGKAGFSSFITLAVAWATGIIYYNFHPIALYPANGNLPVWTASSYTPVLAMFWNLFAVVPGIVLLVWTVGYFVVDALSNDNADSRESGRE